MASYKNLEGEDAFYNVAKAKITLADYYVYTSTTRTHYRFYPKINILFDTQQMGGGYIGYFGQQSGDYGFHFGGQIGSFDIPGTEFTFRVRGSTTFKELLTPSIHGGGALVPSDWRTKVKALPKSDMAVSYNNLNSGSLYVNGTYISPIHSPRCSFNGISFVDIQSYYSTTISGDFEPHEEGSRVWSVELTASEWAWDKHIATLTGLNGRFIHFEANGQTIKWSGLCMTDTEALNTWAGWTNPFTGAMSFSYKVDADSFPPNTNTGQLHFKSDDRVFNYSTNQWEQLEWSGLTSPTVNYNSASLQINVGAGFTVNHSSAIPPFTTGSTWSIPYYPLPDHIGNVTLLNPDIVNDYFIVPDEEDIDPITGEPYQVRNNICKITPPINGDDNMAVVITPKILLNRADWVYDNCTDSPYYIRDLNSDLVISTKYNLIKNTDIEKEGVDENATISSPVFDKPFYSDEGLREVDNENLKYADDYINPELTKFFRQKHSTKARFLQLDLTERVQIGTDELTEEPIYEYIYPQGVMIDFIMYDYAEPEVSVDEETGVPIYSPPNEKKKWTYTLNAVDYNSSENLFNIPLIDLTRVFEDEEGDKFDHSSDYMVSCEVENFGIDEIYESYLDENEELQVKGADILWREELPTTNDIDTPNIVAKIVVHLPKDKVYRLGEIKSFVAPYNYVYNGNNNQPYNLVKDEFREVDYVGDHNPHKGGDPFDENFEFYLLRYIKGIVNGKASYEIPYLSKTLTNYEPELYTPLTFNSLYVDDVMTCSSCNYEFHYCLSNGIKCPNCGVALSVSDELKKHLGDRAIYPRDDLGEIYFNIVDYPADSDGHYPIDAIYNGKESYVAFLRENVDGNGKVKYLGVKSIPRFDTLSGEELCRYINNIDKPLPVIADYGGYVYGLSSVRDTDIVSNSSKYPTIQNYYNGKPIGLDWYVAACGTGTTVRNGEQNYMAIFNPVVDGVKYVYSFIRNMYAILTDGEGNILVDKWHRILYGLGKIFVNNGDNNNGN